MLKRHLFILMFLLLSMLKNINVETIMLFQNYLIIRKLKRTAFISYKNICNIINVFVTLIHRCCMNVHFLHLHFNIWNQLLFLYIQLKMNIWIMNKINWIIWPILEICALRLAHPRCTHTAVNTHTNTNAHTHLEHTPGAVGRHLCCRARGAVVGSVPYSRAPQSWYWRYMWTVYSCSILITFFLVHTFFK